MASLPDDNRFLLLKGLRQTLHLTDQDETSAAREQLSQDHEPEADGEKGDETQKLRRRSDRARATSAVGLGCHMDLESAVPLPSNIESLGQALTAALDEASDARPAFQALVEAGYADQSTAPVTSQFILRSFANDLSSLSKLVTSDTLLAELRQGSSLLAQAMALRWDLTGETRSLQQLANAFVATKSELTNATAAEFGLALATAIALSQPELADRLLGFASEHIADDADPGLINDALHCMDAGRLLQTMPAVIQSVWQQRLRFADRNWNWDTTESRRVLNSLARVIQPDSLSLPLFKRIVPEDQWTKMFTQGEAFAVDASTPSEDPRTEEFTLEDATPVPVAELTDEAEPEPLAEFAAEAEPEALENPEPVAEQVTTPDESIDPSSDALPEVEAEHPAPAIESQKPEEEVIESPPESMEKSVKEPEPIPETTPAEPVPEPASAEPPAPAEAKPALAPKPLAPTPKAKLAPKADAPPITDAVAAPASPPAVKPAARNGFLTFIAGAVGGLLVAFAVWAALPAKLQTLASAAAIESKDATPAPQAPPPAPKKVEPPVSTVMEPKVEPPAPVVPAPALPKPAQPTVAKSEPSAPPASAVASPSKPAAPPPADPAPKPQPAPEPAAAMAPTQPASPPAPVANKDEAATPVPSPKPQAPAATSPPAASANEMVGPPAAPTSAPAPKPSAPPEVVSKPEPAGAFEIWKQKRVVQMLAEHPSMKDWAFTAQNRSLRDSTHLIVGRHPLIPHKSTVHQSLLTLLVLDPPKDPDAARASLSMFSRVCPPTQCLEVWEPMVEAKVPQTDDIRRAAGVMVELMSIKLSAATRQRLERLANGK